MRLSPILASLANALNIPLRTSLTVPIQCSSFQPTSILRKSSLLLRSRQRSLFSTTSPALARKGIGGPKADKRITLIRYFLSHSLVPRGLRFSRNRHLRHWTIHRAHMMHREKLRQLKELELERQYNAMAAACEDLRTNAGDGGRLFRVAMLKRGVWKGMPIEYGRIQTEHPSSRGWDHEWKR